MTSSTPRFKRMVPSLGTFVRIELELPKDVFDRISTRAFERISTLEKQLSFFEPESEISRLNAAKPNEWVMVSSETIALLKLATKLSEDSNGAFSAGNHLVFNETQIVFLVQKTNDQKIDLGGIAKGFIVDQAWSEVLNLAQMEGFETVYGSINAGGDLRLNEREAVQIPIQNANGGFAMHSLKSGALATSSTVKKENTAATYSPAQKAYRQTVSVEAKEAWLADALTKVALFHPNPEACLAKWNARLVYEA